MEGGLQNKGDKEQQEECRRILGRRWSLAHRYAIFLCSLDVDDSLVGQLTITGVT